METLPAEVFNELLDQLEPRGREGSSTNPRRNPWALPQPYRPDHIDSRQHFASLRLVCKRFSELAAPYLFRSIGLRFNTKSFQRLEKLAENEKLSRHVKKFVYLMPYLYEEGIKDFEAFRSDQDLGLSNKIRQIMFEEREPYYYPSVLKEQQDLMRDQYDLKVLKKALKAFTTLQEIQLLAIMVHKDIVLRNLASSFDNWEFTDCKWIPACQHAVETLALAVATTNSPVSALCSPTMSPQSLILLSPKLRPGSDQLWKQLSYLEVTCDERPDRSYLDTSGTILLGHNDAVAKMFQGFLHLALNLTTLYIRFTPGMPVRLPLKDAFHKITWPKLRVLGIGSWMLHADELIQIVRRHKNTLQGLRLSEVYLLNGDMWRDVVVAVKQDIPRIEWVGLHDISYEREYVRKQAYIETYSDTSSDAEDEEYGLDMDRLSYRSRDSISISSTTASHDHIPAPDDDQEVVYGNVFMNLGSSHAAAAGGGPGSVSGSSIHGNSSLGALIGYNVADMDESEEEVDLEDNGRTVSQAQRRHWERWIVGKTPMGTPYINTL
ncbi:hypothetical protein EDC01DRAFT_611607 [Geopyxis carbonaria]|nr:hypothetical protein EDC01DRAFT_611607 [Geopyxis carbonaria]